MHGLYKRFLLFCAVFVALIFAVVGVARVGRDGVRHPFWRVAEGVNDAER